MGLFSWFRPRRKEVDSGLWYRVKSARDIIVEASPEWYETSGDESPVSRESNKEFLSCNMAVYGCCNEGDAMAVRTVLWNMDLFCQQCDEQLCHDDRRCPSCKAKLWDTNWTFTLVKVDR